MLGAFSNRDSIIDRLSPAEKRVSVGLVLGLVPVLLLSQHWFAPGFPFRLDGISNLLPPLHARHSIRNGHLPIYTELWFNGHYQFMNPLWKGFYPPAWPLFIPGFPILTTLKIVLAIHYLATPAIAFWYGSQDFDWKTAAAFSILFATPMAFPPRQFQYVLAWPWVVLAVWQVTPPRLTARPYRHGLIAGAALGMILNAGSPYYFFYTGLIVGGVAMVSAGRDYLRGVVKGSLVGLPHLLFSIIPVIVAGSGRPPVGFALTMNQAVINLIGISVTGGLHVPVDGLKNGGYAVIGLPIVLLGVGGVVYALATHDHRQWGVSVTGVGVLGWLLATNWSVLYQVPGVNSFRVAHRAYVIVALTLLLASWLVIRECRSRGTAAMKKSVLVAVVLSSLFASGTWYELDTKPAPETSVDTDVAAAVADTGGSEVWLNRMATPYRNSIQFQLTQSGVAVVSAYYGQIGQTYATHRNGQRTFDTYVTGRQLPESGRVKLARGYLVAENWKLAERVGDKEGRSVFIYRPKSTK